MLIAPLLGATILLLPSCSSDSRSRKEHRQEEQLAVEYGRQAALRLAPDSLLLPSRGRNAEPEYDTIAMERVLIDVRVRETTLRKRGEEKLADIYIETFLTTLDSVNPALRAELR